MADHRGRTTVDAEDMADRPDRGDATTRPVEDRAPLRVTEAHTTRRAAVDVGDRRELDHITEVGISEASNLGRDRVRWGPILAGLCTALTSLLLLSLLGLAFGLTVVNAGTAAAQGAAPDDAGRNTAVWGVVSALISFFLGGYVAGKTAAVFDRGWGALNGALVFLVAVPVTLWLASMGLGSIMGTLGNFASSLNADPGATQQAGQNIQPIDVARAAERVRNAAWGTLLGAVLGLGASALGGMMGTRRALEANRATGRVSE